ncbi:MAG: gliding motility-associated C-terminal domain-containing protein [Saprospiraceae bacterium]|nr:gliding motility-associated C-terminal domain-containing protein [Saprospiraceae bacterium]
MAATCDPAQAGISVAIQPSALGCDSTIITTTSLLPSDSTLISGVTCDPAGAIYNVILLSNQYGCDSVVTTDIQYVGIDTLYVEKTTCEPSQVGTIVSVLPGVDCDTVLVTETNYLPFTQSEETIILCGQTGILSDTTYLQNSAGCDSLAIRYYEYVSLASQFQIQGETCAGDQDGHIEIINISGGQAPFELQLNAGDWQSATVFNDLSPGQYTILIRDAAGCLDTLSGLVITAGASLAIDAGPDRIAAPGEVIDLSAQTTQSLSQVQWTASDPLSCPTCLQTSLGPLTVNQTVVVTGWTQEGCSDSDALEVIIKTRGNIFIPNSFTPNGDGINDVFSIYGNDQINRIKNLAIFDRWGNALYSRSDLPINDPSAGWDGTFRDEVMDPGVYIYVVEVELIDGSVRLYKGDVTLTR